MNNISHSIFSNVEVYNKSQQIYDSKGLYVHKSYISIKIKGAISEYKGVLPCEGYDYQKFPDEIMEAPVSEHFFTTRMKMLSKTNGFMLYGKMEYVFSPFLNCHIQLWKLS